MTGAMRADQPNAGMAIEGRREFEGVRSFSHEAMATVFEVHAAHPDARYAAQAAQAAFDLADRLERELSRFIPNSDISRINGLAAGSTVQVGPAAMECLVIARHMFDVTDGAFDVSIGTGLPSLELDRDDCLVRAARSGTRIDLGGIGKGYAVDLMVELLEDWGLEQALVHGGFSSILALEAPPDLSGWPLTLSDPAAPSHILARLSVRQTALGASGRRKGDHVVDPRTGEPARGRRAAWVVVPRPQIAGLDARTDESPRIAPAAVADALTTAFLLQRVEEIEALCERSRGVEAWILPDPDEGGGRDPRLLHFGGSGPGYTSASSESAT